MDCQFVKFGLHQVRCKVCTETLPKFDNWQAIKKNCPGRKPLGAAYGSVKNQRPDPPAAIVTLPPGRNKAAGPGWQLLDYYRTQGVPSCQACAVLALQMDQWGIAGCRQHLEQIVSEILPRAKQWVAQNKPWIHKLLPDALEDFGIRLKIRADVTAAIDRAASTSKSGAKPGAVPFTEPVTRNLLMWIYPKKGPVWRWNVEQIARRIELFNGKKVFAIATDATTDSVQVALDAVDALADDVLHFQNSIGEVTGFNALLGSVASTNPNEVTYYCHAKGVTKQGTPGMQSIQRWTEAMHEVLLDGYDEAQDALESHAFAGAFRATKPAFGMSAWHFPGTFYWFRNSDIFSLPNWATVQNEYYGTEAWPGRLVGVSRSACLLADQIPLADLYKPDRWEKTYQPALEAWRKRRAARMEAVT